MVPKTAPADSNRHPAFRQVSDDKVKYGKRTVALKDKCLKGKMMDLK